eukprot:193713-Chlamydomonas_euryale.AAC.1
MPAPVPMPVPVPIPRPISIPIPRPISMSMSISISMSISMPLAVSRMRPTPMLISMARLRTEHRLPHRSRSAFKLRPRSKLRPARYTCLGHGWGPPGLGCLGKARPLPLFVWEGTLQRSDSCCARLVQVLRERAGWGGAMQLHFGLPRMAAGLLWVSLLWAAELGLAGRGHATRCSAGSSRAARSWLVVWVSDLARMADPADGAMRVVSFGNLPNMRIYSRRVEIHAMLGHGGGNRSGRRARRWPSGSLLSPSTGSTGRPAVCRRLPPRSRAAGVGHS